MSHPVERHQVVFARRVEGNVLHEDKLFVVKVKRGGEDLRRMLVQAREDLRIGLGNTLGCVLQASAVRVFTNSKQDFAYCCFDARAVYFVAPLSVRG